MFKLALKAMEESGASEEEKQKRKETWEMFFTKSQFSPFLNNLQKRKDTWEN